MDQKKDVPKSFYNKIKDAYIHADLCSRDQCQRSLAIHAKQGVLTTGPYFLYVLCALAHTKIMSWP